MIIPNFLIIGAPKSGTSALYEYLKQHPQIYMSSNKEPHFFFFLNGDNDLAGKEGIREKTWLWNNRVTNMEDYVKLFEGVKNEKAIGEASTMYLYSKECPARIKKYIPDVKLIAILRNPIERCYSHFLMCVERNYEPYGNDFKRAIRDEERRFNEKWGVNFYYTKLSLYYNQLERYYDIFDTSQIRVYIYEEFLKNPLHILKDIFNFLDVDEDIVPGSLDSRFNISGIPKQKLLWLFYQEVYKYRNVLKQFMPNKFLKFVSARTHQKLYSHTFKPSLSADMRSELLNIFRKDIIKLQNLLNKDLSMWLH